MRFVRLAPRDWTGSRSPRPSRHRREPSPDLQGRPDAGRRGRAAAGHLYL